MYAHFSCQEVFTVWKRSATLLEIVFYTYSHCGGVSCDFRREITCLCPNAKVHEPLGVLEDPGEDLPHILRAWLEKNSLPEPQDASAG
jgi:hypothetical protein